MSEYKQIHIPANNPVRQSGAGKGAVQLQDNRNKAASNKSIIQKVSVENVNQKNTSYNSDKFHLPSTVAQLVSVNIIRDVEEGSSVSSELLKTAIDTMKKIVEDAEAAKGKANSGKEHQRLTEILEEKELKGKLPTSSNSTFGLGGSNYFGNTPFTTTQGTEKFGKAVASLPNIGKTEHLGARDTGTHDEIHQITAYPGLQALTSSQGHCFFCYGTIHDRGYEHGELRKTTVWPQNWQHDYLGFKLKKTSEKTIDEKFSKDPVIKITSNTKGVAYYIVSKAG
jgi:hypothetical protein